LLAEEVRPFSLMRRQQKSVGFCNTTVFTLRPPPPPALLSFHNLSERKTINIKSWTTYRRVDTKGKTPVDILESTCLGCLIENATITNLRRFQSS
jgi:hypothetical protein